MAGSTARTDFASRSHPELIQMLHASDPDAVTATGDTWASIGRSLHDRAGDLEDQLRGFDGMWQGDAATAYHAMLSDLVDAVRQTATTALAMRDRTYQAGEALLAAWRGMPPAVTVPASASTVAVAAASAAQAQAAAVLTWLADRDVALEAAVPQPPSATVPAVSADGSVRPGSGGLVNPVAAGGPPAPPLLSRVFTAGIAAAAAAAGGRFGGPLIKLPGRASPAPAGGVRPGGQRHPSAVAARTLTPSAPATVLAAWAAGAAVGSPPAGQSTAAGGFIPAMPFGAAGAGDGPGGGRRIPPWLVETEEVWGESAPVVPSVLGEEPADPALDQRRYW
jgi:uncharacterized protein YukE